MEDIVLIGEDAELTNCAKYEMVYFDFQKQKNNTFHLIVGKSLRLFERSLLGWI